MPMSADLKKIALNQYSVKCSTLSSDVTRPRGPIARVTERTRFRRKPEQRWDKVCYSNVIDVIAMVALSLLIKIKISFHTFAGKFAPSKTASTIPATKAAQLRLPLSLGTEMKVLTRGSFSMM